MRTSSIVSASAHLAVIAALLWAQQALDAKEAPGVEAVTVLFVAPPAPAAGHGGDNAAPGPTEAGAHHARASDTPPAPAPSTDAPDEARVPAPAEATASDRPETPPVQLATLPQPIERKIEPTPDPPVAQQVEIEPPKPLPLPKLKPEQPVLAADMPPEPQPPEPQLEKAPTPAPLEPVAPASPPAPSPTDTQIAHSDPTRTATDPTAAGGSTSGVQSASLPSASDDLPASTGGGDAGNGEVGPAGGGAVSEDYAALLAAWLDEHKRYPERARRKNQEGVVVFAFEIDAEGRVLHHRIVEGSGYPLLDEEVTELIDRAAPLPAPPPGVVRSYVVPIVFALR